MRQVIEGNFGSVGEDIGSDDIVDIIAKGDGCVDGVRLTGEQVEHGPSMRHRIGFAELSIFTDSFIVCPYDSIGGDKDVLGGQVYIVLCLLKSEVASYLSGTERGGARFVIMDGYDVKGYIQLLEELGAPERVRTEKDIFHNDGKRVNAIIVSMAVP